MGRPEEAAELVSQGYTPSEIAKELGISVKSVMQYLYRAIGMGYVRRSDVLFNIQKKQGGEGVVMDDLLICEGLRQDRVELGDLYEFLADLEKTLHERVRTVLVEEFGDGESGWWRNGVPKRVRKQCATLREDSEEESPSEVYCYTSFVNLVEIIDKNWKLFQKRLPASRASNKRHLMSSLYRVAEIRNRVMHPIRSDPPTEADFEFVQQMHDKLVHVPWR